MRAMIAALVFTLAAFFAVNPAAEAQPAPEERMEDEALQERARDLYRGLRCVVCQSQSIEESEAQVAKDLRRLVRERLEAGDSDAEVYQYVRDRYGDYVLRRPPLQLNTALLWITPLLLLLIGGGGAFLFIRSQSAPAPGRPSEDALSEAEEERLRQLLEDEPQ